MDVDEDGIGLVLISESKLLLVLLTSCFVSFRSGSQQLGSSILGLQILRKH